MLTINNEVQLLIATCCEVQPTWLLDTIKNIIDTNTDGPLVDAARRALSICRREPVPFVYKQAVYDYAPAIANSVTSPDEIVRITEEEWNAVFSVVFQSAVVFLNQHIDNLQTIIQEAIASLEESQHGEV